MTQAHIYFLVVSLISLCGCGIANRIEPKITQQETYLISLNDSTDIILQLIKRDNLTQILEDTDPEKLDFLIKNFTPAEIAFESEVLNALTPIIIYFYDSTKPDQNALLPYLEECAKKYDNQLKFVVIDFDKLPTLLRKFAFEQVPALSVMRDRQEIMGIAQEPNKCDIDVIIAQLI
jgi:thiol-disulfide isomerase/thioredoxin